MLKLSQNFLRRAWNKLVKYGRENLLSHRVTIVGYVDELSHHKAIHLLLLDALQQFAQLPAKPDWAVLQRCNLNQNLLLHLLITLSL